jgi:hypothetical protein
MTLTSFEVQGIVHNIWRLKFCVMCVDTDCSENIFEGHFGFFVARTQCLRLYIQGTSNY